MSLVSGLPSRPVSKDECRELEANDDVVAVAPVGTEPVTEDGSGVADLVIVTEQVVAGVALINKEWEIIYRGRRGDDGDKSELFDRAWEALEDCPRTPDVRYRV